MVSRVFSIIISLFFITACSTSHPIVLETGSGSNSPTYVKSTEERDIIANRPYSYKEGYRLDAKTTSKKDVSIEIANKDEPDEDDGPLLMDEQYRKNFDIPIVFNDAVQYFIQYFTNEKRKVFGNWLKRAKYYVPVYKEILKREGLPEDLVYLAMIESGFNSKAYSPAKASGPWQFIYSTGERYGLKVDYWIDERRDPEKSTIAAARYLRDLFNQFGCWYLAAAGYNAGEKRVERAIEKHSTTDIWELVKYNTLPKETREYIPKLIAAAIIAKDPERYGFGSIVYDEPITFVEVRVPPATPLDAIASAASTDMVTLRSLNPELLRGITPPDVQNYPIRLASGVNIVEFNKNFEEILRNRKRIKQVIDYKVKSSDNLNKIIKRYQITKDDLLLVNSDDGRLKIRPKMVLRIPIYGDQERYVVASTSHKKAMPTAFANKEDTPKESTKNATLNGKAIYLNGQTTKKEVDGPKKLFHIVKKGETLTAIADRYGISPSDLKSFNNLKSDKICPKMKLRLVAYKHKKGEKVVKYHIVKKGETLTAIADRYGISPSDLKSFNNLKSDKICPKMKLRLTINQG